MSSQSMPASGTTPGENEVSDADQIAGDIPIEPPVDKGRQKRGISSFWYDRIIEISLVIYILVALLQLVLQRSNWPYWLTWQELRDRLGPFSIPVLVFFLAAT